MEKRFRTGTKRLITLTDEDDYFIGDIATALSNTSRFNGHFGFYSVAQHSILVSNVVEQNTGDPALAYSGLMHDASEAYMNDIVTSVKRKLPAYYEIEEELMLRIAKQHRFEWPKPNEVDRADNEVLYVELRDLCKLSGAEEPMVTLADKKMQLVALGPGESRPLFLERYVQLRYRLGL